MGVPALMVPSEAAHYPALYTAARAALFRCDQVDECQEWANKAAALESYARQAKDQTLEDMAKRIRARAVRRCGELLEKVPAVPRTLTRKAAGVATRTAIATAAGLNEHQKNRALQVARVPAADFEQLVEAPKPASISALAKQGSSPRGARRGPAWKRLTNFARWCETHDPVNARSAVEAADVRAIAAWCSKFLEAK